MQPVGVAHEMDIHESSIEQGRLLEQMIVIVGYVAQPGR